MSHWDRFSSILLLGAAAVGCATAPPPVTAERIFGLPVHCVESREGTDAVFSCSLGDEGDNEVFREVRTANGKVTRTIRIEGQLEVERIILEPGKRGLFLLRRMCRGWDQPVPADVTPPEGGGEDCPSGAR
jgi:hypothetical protein